MKTFLIGAIAAIGLGLIWAPTDASAYWAVRTVQRWDPFAGAYITVQKRVWVPAVAVVEPPVAYPTPVRVVPRPVIVGPVVPVPVPVVRPVIIQPFPY
jgi:hypothetical protein